MFYEESGSCKRSPDAYGPKIAAARGYALSFQACSGAKTTDVNAKQLGTLSSSTALFWAWAHITGRLPEPEREGIEPDEVEVHGEPAG